MRSNLLKLKEEKIEFTTKHHSTVTSSYQLTFGNIVMTSSECIFDIKLTSKSRVRLHLLPDQYTGLTAGVTG